VSNETPSAGARIYATHRMVTGAAYSIGYVMNRNRVLASCGHRHRKGARAQRCAERMVRKLSSADPEVKP
jgi:hypothetical protein